MKKNLWGLISPAIALFIVSAVGALYAQVRIQWVYPGVQDVPMQATSPCTVEFDTEISGLTDSDTMYYYFIFRMIDPDWNEIVSEAVVTEMPYETTFVNPYSEPVEIWYELYGKVNDEGNQIFPVGEPNPSAWFVTLAPSSNSIKKGTLRFGHAIPANSSRAVFTLDGRKVTSSQSLPGRNAFPVPACLHIIRNRNIGGLKRLRFQDRP
ncbi:MAG: hypothetical protein GF401_03765 [Chitinivibrionales bacterium]|nr:hypothetical protein [Chitinivibrionales bacterium]